MKSLSIWIEKKVEVKKPLNENTINNKVEMCDNCCHQKCAEINYFYGLLCRIDMMLHF